MVEVFGAFGFGFQGFKGFRVRDLAGQVRTM